MLQYREGRLEVRDVSAVSPVGHRLPLPTLETRLPDKGMFMNPLFIWLFGDQHENAIWLFAFIMSYNFLLRCDKTDPFSCLIFACFIQKKVPQVEKSNVMSAVSKAILVLTRLDFVLRCYKVRKSNRIFLMTITFTVRKHDNCIRKFEPCKVLDVEEKLLQGLHCVADGDSRKERRKTLSGVARASDSTRGSAGANPTDTPTANGGPEEISAQNSAYNSATLPREEW